ncbi:MAG: phosphoesterase [Bacteroidetes bacterium]|nr:MAG: phosphoesterase [Bacteroidota bacterium]
MKTRLILFTALFLMFMSAHFISSSQIKIGVFADCQYCDCETAGSRFYRNSPTKLESCIEYFNNDDEIEFIVNLGDLIDRDFESFETIKPIIEKSKKRIYSVIGNHDLSVEKSLLEKVPLKLNLEKTWYSFSKDDWHFIFLNGNDITFHSNNQKVVQQAKKITEKIKSEDKPNYHDWNGGIGKEQLKWLEKELKSAQKKNQKVAVFCHYPLLPFEAHALWNSEEVLEILEKQGNVKIYLNGHNHRGNYALQNGIHFVNLKGMVETENENAFSIISFSDKQIEIKGFGREESRLLKPE